MSDKKQNIYAIYIRVSTERQAEHGDSIEMQEALGMQIIKENNGIHYRTYIEPAVSASKTELKNREVLMECLNDAKNGLFNKLIVYKRDRLARKLEDAMAIWDILKKANCELIFSATGEMQAMMNDPYGKMLEAIKASIAEIESATISVRVSDTLKNKAKKGEFTGGNLPYGYVLKDKKIVLVPEEAKIIKEIEDLYLAGYGLYSIAKWLNGEKVNNLGYRPEGRAHRRKQHKNSSEFWTKEVINTILFNPFYTGIIEYSTSGDRRFVDDDSLIIRAKGNHESCRTPERHEQILREKRRRESEISEPRRYTTSFLLTGLLYCSECGNKFYGRNSTQNRKRYSYYVCGGKSGITHIGKEPCPSKQFKKELLEEFILQKIIEYISNVNLDSEIQKIQESLNESDQKLKTALEETNKKIERLNKDYAAIRRLLLDLDENDEDYELLKESYQSDQAEILKKLNEAKKTKQELENQLNMQSDQENVIQTIIEEIRDFSKNIHYVPYHMKKVMIDKIIEKIEIDKDGDVKLYFSIPLSSKEEQKDMGGKISFISFGGVGDTTTTKKIKIEIHLSHHKYNFFEWIRIISDKIKSSFIDWIKLHVNIKSARQMHKDTGISETTCREIINKKRTPMPKTIKRIVEVYHLNLKSFINFMGISISEEGLFHIIEPTISGRERKCHENGRFN